METAVHNIPIYTTWRGTTETELFTATVCEATLQARLRGRKLVGSQVKIPDGYVARLLRARCSSPVSELEGRKRGRDEDVTPARFVATVDPPTTAKTVAGSMRFEQDATLLVWEHDRIPEERHASGAQLLGTLAGIVHGSAKE